MSAKIENPEKIEFKLEKQRQKLKELLNDDIGMLFNPNCQNEKDGCLNLLKQTNIYKIYQQIIPDPFIVYLPGPIDLFFFNIMLWYYTLQIGLINQDNFVIKGGFSIQLMIDSKYNTSDIDIKSENEKVAERIKDKLVGLNTSHYSQMLLTKHFEDNKLFKLSLNLQHGKKAFMDIDYSSTPENTSRFFTESEIHQRKAILGKDRFTFSFTIYPLAQQIEEKQYLMKKYKSEMFKNIKLFKNDLNDLKITPQFFLDYLLEMNQAYLSSPRRLVLGYAIDKDEIISYIMANEIKTENGDKKISMELANKIYKFYSLNENDNNISYDLFIINKFQKALSALERGNAKNKWSRINQNLTNIYTKENSKIKLEEEEIKRKIENEKIREEEEKQAENKKKRNNEKQRRIKIRLEEERLSKELKKMGQPTKQSIKPKNNKTEKKAEKKDEKKDEKTEQKSFSSPKFNVTIKAKKNNPPKSINPEKIPEKKPKKKSVRFKENNKSLSPPPSLYRRILSSLRNTSTIQ